MYMFLLCKDILLWKIKILGLEGKVPNASAGSRFQFLMVLFKKEYFPIFVLCFLSLIFRT